MQLKQLAFLALLLSMVQISYWSKQLLEIGLSFFAYNASHASRQTQVTVVKLNFLLALRHWRNVPGSELTEELSIVNWGLEHRNFKQT